MKPVTEFLHASETLLATSFLIGTALLASGCTVEVSEPDEPELPAETSLALVTACDIVHSCNATLPSPCRPDFLPIPGPNDSCWRVSLWNNLNLATEPEDRQ